MIFKNEALSAHLPATFLFAIGKKMVPRPLFYVFLPTELVSGVKLRIGSLPGVKKRGFFEFFQFFLPISAKKHNLGLFFHPFQLEKFQNSILILTVPKKIAIVGVKIYARKGPSVRRSIKESPVRSKLGKGRFGPFEAR